MARPKVIIADEDENYIISLQFKFITEFFNKIDLEIITDKSYFAEYFSKPQTAEILVVSDNLYNETLLRHNIQNIFVMMEQLDDGGTGDLNITQLFKYSSIKEIFNEITGKSAGALNIAAVEKKETQLIIVTSAAGGVGKTTVSMGMAGFLAQNYKRVLYINASRLQNFQNMLQNKSFITSQDAYSRLLSPSDRIYSDIAHVIRKEIFSYIPAFKASLLSVGLDFSIFKTIALSAKKSNDYDFIIIDLENTFDEQFTEMLGLADKVIVVTTQNTQSINHTNLFVTNVNGANTDKYIFVCNNFKAEENNALIKSDIDVKFNVENYIEHIPTIEKLSIAEYAKVQGIQKMSLLVM
jgi:MinD-like ATPase involved in chromosome partitioning or flagellar assembly